MNVCLCVLESSVYFHIDLHLRRFYVILVRCSGDCLLCMLYFLHEIFPLIYQDTSEQSIVYNEDGNRYR